MNTKQMIENLGHIPPPPFFAEENKMTNTVDMKQAVPGATVHFRCGGSAVVNRKSDTLLEFDGYDGLAENSFSHREHRWYEDGRFLKDGNHPIDIIRIDPPAFKWDNVKAGMAFTNSIGQLIYFIGNSVSITGGHILEYASTEESASYTGMVYPNDTGDLTRAPEHDKVGG